MDKPNPPPSSADSVDCSHLRGRCGANRRTSRRRDPFPTVIGVLARAWQPFLNCWKAGKPPIGSLGGSPGGGLAYGGRCAPHFGPTAPPSATKLRHSRRRGVTY